MDATAMARIRAAKHVQAALQASDAVLAKGGKARALSSDLSSHLTLPLSKNSVRLQRLVAASWRLAVAAARGAAASDGEVSGALSSSALRALHDHGAAQGQTLLTAHAVLLLRGRRQLSTGNSEDTYGDSLVSTNRLFTAAFGRRSRKVPAHMPHMIDIGVMTALQAKWPAAFEATSAHRFRSSDDVQYAFGESERCNGSALLLVV